MKVQVQELSSIERKLSIEVPPEQVREELDRAYAQLSRQVKVPGFRPGKVPRRILEQRYREQVEDDVIQRVVERSYLTAISENKVEAVSRPQVTPGGALKADEPFAYEARVEVKPRVEVKDYRELPLKKAERTVEEAKVNAELESMREEASRLEPVEDRKVVQAGDIAIASYRATLDGQPFAGSEAENISLEVTPGELVESHCAALEGVEVGATKELDYAFPSDYRLEDLRGKVAHFRIDVTGLKRKHVPELNDDFAREAGGGAQTVEELRAKVRQDLQKSLDGKAESEERDGVLGAIIERNAFEVPVAMVNRALDMMLEGALRNLARSGLDPRMLNLDFNHLREELRERALREVKGSLLLEALARQENIAASEEEVNARIEKLAADAGQSLSSVRKHFQSPSERESLALRLREEKTIEFLKAHAKYS